MTKETFESIKETIAQKWHALYEDASPADIFGSMAIYMMPGWVQEQVGARPRITKNQHYEIAKEIRRQSDGLKAAKRMLERPPLGGFVPGQEG